MRRWLLIIPAILFVGCGDGIEQYTRPEQVVDFAVLYGSHCAGCHGRDGRGGAARTLNDPLFLAVIGKEKLRGVIAMGVPRSAMPGFAQNAGGSLTDEQITTLATQIEEGWARPAAFAGVILPPYSADSGDPKAGAIAFRTYCASCHGDDGTGGGKAGSIVDPSFLALVTDQSLRSTVIAGRSDPGTPDSRKCLPEHPMTAQEISNVVAWISAHRTPITLTQRGTKLP